MIALSLKSHWIFSSEIAFRVSKSLRKLASGDVVINICRSMTNLVLTAFCDKECGGVIGVHFSGCLCYSFGRFWVWLICQFSMWRGVCNGCFCSKVFWRILRDVNSDAVKICRWLPCFLLVVLLRHFVLGLWWFVGKSDVMFPIVMFASGLASMAWLIGIAFPTFLANVLLFDFRFRRTFEINFFAAGFCGDGVLRRSSKPSEHKEIDTSQSYWNSILPLSGFSLGFFFLSLSER